jgi:hypothetical protein
VGGGVAFREGLCEDLGRLGLFFLFCQAPWGKPATLSHASLAPHPCTRIPEPTTSYTLSSPLAIVICACFLQGLTMNQMRKSQGRKVSLPRYLAAHPHPTWRWAPERGQGRAWLGWAVSLQGQTSRSICQDHLVCLIAGDTGGAAKPTGLRKPEGPRDTSPDLTSSWARLLWEECLEKEQATGKMGDKLQADHLPSLNPG